ncbi:N-acetylmuramoyl-L-alanine amidase [Clostridium beijerinckii]|uniref:N-acetylmuramoyl-L-alanine amidase n=1 Tax=Clostridium beijerinckii TaxID=1520 RepID=UPI001494AEA5|nr:N-acetylmuramoyl-L-alanine amidase [Clostridium beijerinckii]NOW08040.1 N-acetylmuramoyl-L-alanine amidase [Clostridium beijerinckii]NYC05684.1 N-acetylmuramoyl-L-alanine amidase [Clostridium beijerinckii]
MKIGLRGGHSSNCIGAVGIVNEYEQMQQYFKYVRDLLIQYGHTVIDCNSNGSNANAELSEGAAAANAANVDLFVSLHMNAFDGSGHGVEALVSSESSKALPYAQRLCNNFGSLGFTNRGVKYEKLYEMNHIAAGNIIFEICFCDSETDMAIYRGCSWQLLAHRFCNAIDSNIPADPAVAEMGYVITTYLPQLSDDYDGVNINSALEYFGGVTCYVRSDNKGIWIETQYLTIDKCNELKDILGSWYWRIEKN